MSSYYLDGCDILGVDPAYGPLSPADLANLDRPLTPAEQKAVDDWQSSQANAAQAAEEKKGGPAATMAVTPQGAVVTRAPQGRAPLGRPPVWPLFIVASVAVIGLGATVALLAKSKWGWALANFFLITPVAVAGVGAGVVVATGKELAA